MYYEICFGSGLSIMFDDLSALMTTFSTRSISRDLNTLKICKTQTTKNLENLENQVINIFP